MENIERNAEQAAERLMRTLLAKGVTVSTAESCTGGLLAKLLTDIAGSSGAFVGSFVTYTNEMKMQFLGVSPQIIANDTEVSFACAKAMAEGVRSKIGTDYAIATTGYAGPGGGNEKDPVGTVYLGFATPNRSFSERFFAGDGLSRSEVRFGAAARVLTRLNELIEAE